MDVAIADTVNFALHEAEIATVGEGGHVEEGTSTVLESTQPISAKQASTAILAASIKPRLYAVDASLAPPPLFELPSYEIVLAPITASYPANGICSLIGFIGSRVYLIF